MERGIRSQNEECSRKMKNAVTKTRNAATERGMQSQNEECIPRSATAFLVLSLHSSFCHCIPRFVTAFFVF